MSTRIEWRTRAEGDDSIIAIDEDVNTIVQVWPVDHTLLVDYLNDMKCFANPGRSENPLSEKDQDRVDWGEPVLSRLVSGEVIDVDPERYWTGVSIWFRSRGDDPHRSGRAPRVLAGATQTRAAPEDDGDG